MTNPVPDLAAARPQPTLRTAEPTLAATVPTTMLLVDYALNDNAMPVPELIALADSLPAELVDKSRAVRATMAHGAVLRSVLMHQLPSDHPGHLEWPALRRFIASWPEPFLNALIDCGVGSNMRYLDPTAEPGPSAADIESAAGPTAAVRRDGAVVLRSWGLPQADERAAELLDPLGFRSTLLELLDAIWDGWLGVAWHDQLPMLRAAAASAPAPPPGCTPTQWISLVTGLRPDPSYAEAAEQATELIIMPAPGLGRSLSLFADQQTWVLYTPQDQDDQASGSRTGISIGRLGQLAPAMTALGDRTRLAIVLHLLDHGQLTMPQLADALEVHQSTVSRQVNALRRAGIVTVRDRRVEVDRGVIKNAADTLLATLE